MRTRPLLIIWLAVSLVAAALPAFARVNTEVSIKYEVHDPPPEMSPLMAERLLRFEERIAMHNWTIGFLLLNAVVLGFAVARCAPPRPGA